MESAAPQTPVQALEALQNAYSRFLDALPEARRASLGEAIGFFLRSDGNPKLGSLVDAFAEELPVHVEALKTRLAACPAEEADRLATQALELMLLYPRPKDGATEFSLAAFEGFAAPLLPFLAPARRAELAERYRAEGAEALTVDRERIAQMGIELVERPLASPSGDFARHDPDALASAVLDIYRARAVHIYGGSESYRIEK